MDVKVVLEFREGTGAIQNWFRASVGGSQMFAGYESDLMPWQKVFVRESLLTLSIGLGERANKITVK